MHKSFFMNYVRADVDLLKIRISIDIFGTEKCKVTFDLKYQINPDRTRCSGSTERMRVIGEARSIPFFPDRPIFMFTVVYGIVYTMRQCY